MKHLRLCVLCIILVLTNVIFPSLVFAENPISVYLDGEKIEFTTNPVLSNGTTLVPFRTIFEKLGLTVTWEPKTQEIIGEKNDLSILLQIGNKVAIVNGIKKDLPVAPKIINGSTLVPLRFIGETSGKEVNWNADTRIITIGKKDIGNDVPIVIRGYASYSEKPEYRYMGFSEIFKLHDETGEETGIVMNIIGTPELNLVVQNVSNKEIDAFEFTCKLFDTFGRPAYKVGTKDNTFKGIAQKISLPAPVEGPASKPMHTKDFDLSPGYEKWLYRYWDVYTWNLVLYETASEVKDIEITKVHFTDGTTWEK